MNPPRSIVRTYWILAGLATFHAVALSLFLFLYQRGLIPESQQMAEANARLWIGLATLWILWPIVLALHPGRSLVRYFVPLILVAPFLLFSFREYRFSAPVYIFGFPDGVYLSPWSIRDYIVAHRAGRADAQNDLRSGQLAIEIYGFPWKGAREYAETLGQRYQIEVRRVAGDTDVSARVLGHSTGYNEISEAEIKRRFGDQLLKSVAEEAERHYDEKFAK